MNYAWMFRISELETGKAESDTHLKKYSRQLIDLEKLVENLKVGILKISVLTDWQVMFQFK